MGIAESSVFTWKRDRESRLSRARNGLDGSTHELRELMGDRKSQTASGGAGAVDTVEALEYVLEVLRGDAGTLVLHREPCVLPVLRHAKSHRRPGRRVHQRVFDQGPPCAQHPLFVPEC